MRDHLYKIKIQLKNRYSVISLSTKAAIWFAVCSFLQRGISIISTPIFTRLLSTDEFGVFSTYTSWENVLFMVTSLCIYKCTMNLCVKFEEKRDEAFSALCGLALIVTMLWILIGLFFRKGISDLLKLSQTLTVCLFIGFMGKLVFECWSIYKRYLFEYKIILIVTLFLSFGSTGLGLLLVLTYKKTAEIRVISSVLISLVIGIYLYYSVFRKGKCFYKKEVWKFALGFCIPLLPHYLSEFILQCSDKIMINYMCGPRDVALYSIAYSVGSLITFLTSAINLSFAPYQYQKIASKDYKLLSKRTNHVLLVVSIGLGLLMLFSKEIVVIVGGKKYLESSSVIIPICIGVYFNFLFQLFARVQEFFEKKLTIVIPSVFCAALNVILNWVFIKIYGYAAAAYTTFICYLIFCIVHYFFYYFLCKKMLGGIQIYDIRSITLISLFTIIIGGATSLLSNYQSLRYGIFLVLLIATLFQRKKVLQLIKDIIK